MCLVSGHFKYFHIFSFKTVDSFHRTKNCKVYEECIKCNPQTIYKTGCNIHTWKACTQYTIKAKKCTCKECRKSHNAASSSPISAHSVTLANFERREFLLDKVKLVIPPWQQGQVGTAKVTEGQKYTNASSYAWNL